MSHKALILFFFFTTLSYTAQQDTNEFEKYPVFAECENESVQNLKACFNSTLQSYIFNNFQVPQVVFDEEYIGQMVVFFEVTREGEFKILALDAIYQELKDEMKRVFDELPKVKPAVFNARPTYMQFTLPLKIPLQSTETSEAATQVQEIISLQRDQSDEYDQIQNLGYQNDKYTSHINVPLSHRDYARIDFYMNQVGNNAHTAQRPFTYNEVNKYHDMQSRDTLLFKNKSSWFGRK